MGGVQLLPYLYMDLLFTLIACEILTAAFSLVSCLLEGRDHSAMCLPFKVSIGFQGPSRPSPIVGYRLGGGPRTPHDHMKTPSIIPVPSVWSTVPTPLPTWALLPLSQKDFWVEVYGGPASEFNQAIHLTPCPLESESTEFRT